MKLDKNNLALLYVMEAFAGASRGSYLACIGWTTLVITNDVGRVGQVVIAAMLTNILLGLVLGVVVDRHSRKYVVIAAHLGIFVVMLSTGMIWLGQSHPSILWLFVTAVLITSLRLSHHTAHDALIKISVDSEALVHSLARFRTLHLLCTAGGMASAGWLIEVYSPRVGFVYSGLCSALLIIPMLFVSGGVQREKRQGLSGFVGDFTDGLSVFRMNTSIKTLT